MATELSFEFFPPQTAEGLNKLLAASTQLAAFQPDFFSVTYGAGGSTQERSFEAVAMLSARNLCVAPHLSCIGSATDVLRSILYRFREQGIRRCVALRGDLPSGMAQAGELRYAIDLVEFIRKETGDWFHLTVAAYPEWHPQATSPAADLQHFQRKMAAGANAAITQFFYNAEAYARFVDAAQGLGIAQPIIPGIMPIASFSRLARFADTCGAEIPRWMRKKFESYGDDAASIRAFGLDVVTRLCEQLRAMGAPGLHFYTLNQAELSTEIVQRLGLSAA